MSIIKDKVIRWAIRQIVKDSDGSYGDMRYLEDVLENKWGEKMFIFSHRLVAIDKEKLDKANAQSTLDVMANPDPEAPMQSTGG